MSLPALASTNSLAASVPDRAESARVASPVPASAVKTGEAAQSGSARPDREQIEAATQDLRQKLEEKGVELAIEFDDEVDRPIVKLRDSRTGEILRQIPSEEMLVLARAVARSDSVGLLLQDRA